MDRSLPPSAGIDLARWIRPGDGVLWGQANAEPLTLIRALAEQHARLAGCKVFLGIHQSGLLTPEHAGALRFAAYCGSAANRRLADAGVLDPLPAPYSSFPALIRAGALKVDVLLLQVSPADAQGRHSLGLACEYLAAALDVARVVIAEVNDQVPWTEGDTWLDARRIDVAVAASYAPLNSPETRTGPVERAIAAHVAGLVEDGATLQCGLGAVPEAVLAALGQHRRLGVHSGTIGDGVMTLMQAGALTNEAKGRDFGVGVTGLLMGSSALHRFAHRNPALALRRTEYTHNPEVLASLSRFTAINSAIEVDLTGQVNAEMAGGSYVGAVGGAGDFLRGAHRSSGGLPIVALPSTAGARSRIVARLSGPVSTSRSDAGVFVTEHGVADLRGLTLSARIQRMLGIAHPDQRAALEQQAGAALPGAA
jgi:acyl-CoA hydrolase